MILFILCPLYGSVTNKASRLITELDQKYFVTNLGITVCTGPAFNKSLSGFRAFTNFFEILPVPVILIPGNQPDFCIRSWFNNLSRFIASCGLLYNIILYFPRCHIENTIVLVGEILIPESLDPPTVINVGLDAVSFNKIHTQYFKDIPIPHIGV